MRCRTPRRRTARFATLVPALLLVAMRTGAAVAAAPPPDRVVDPPFTALAVDGAIYAARYGVPHATAQARLRAQGALPALVDRIRATYGPRLAGIAIEHVPDYRIVVLLAGGAPVMAETAMLAGLAVPVVYRNDAVATVADIRAAIVRHQSAIRAALIDSPGLGVDERTGALLVTVSERDAAQAEPGVLEGDLTTLTGVPVRIAVLEPGRNLSVAGGRLDAIDPLTHRRSTCTAGFAVTDGRQAAITTAAHCADALSAGGVPLTLLGAWGAGTQDVQIHAAPSPPPPAFRVGSGAVVRPVTGVASRARTVVGDFVCHQGYRSGESCAEVAATSFTPPGDLCAGPCPPEWVAVDGPDCERGDSGGPVFDGTVALGLFKGASFRNGRCALYYYMPVDALPAGWSVLIDPGPPSGSADPASTP